MNQGRLDCQWQVQIWPFSIPFFTCGSPHKSNVNCSLQLTPTIVVFEIKNPQQLCQRACPTTLKQSAKFTHDHDHKCSPIKYYNFFIRIPDFNFSPSKLEMITSVISIDLFDEVMVDILEDDRKRATTLHQRIEKRWLGKFLLPFSTLALRQTVSFFHKTIYIIELYIFLETCFTCNARQIEGTFLLDCPRVLLGYKADYYQDHNPLLGLNNNHQTFLQLYVNLDPPLDIFSPIYKQVC